VGPLAVASLVDLVLIVLAPGNLEHVGDELFAARVDEASHLAARIVEHRVDRSHAVHHGRVRDIRVQFQLEIPCDIAEVLLDDGIGRLAYQRIAAKSTVFGVECDDPGV
jgi:hypothetical protein